MSRHFIVWKDTSKQAWRCGSTTITQQLYFHLLFTYYSAPYLSALQYIVIHTMFCSAHVSISHVCYIRCFVLLTFPSVMYVTYGVLFRSRFYQSCMLHTMFCSAHVRISHVCNIRCFVLLTFLSVMYVTYGVLFCSRSYQSCM